jgi:hypothetical protein
MRYAIHNIPDITNTNTVDAATLQLQSVIDNVSQAVNLTGVTIEWVFYKNNFDGPEIFKLTTSNGGLTITNATAGTFTRNPFNWVYNHGLFNHICNLYFPGNIKKTYFIGEIRVHQPN